jgi:uncharacterized protein (DUF1697 family)
LRGFDVVKPAKKVKKVAQRKAAGRERAVVALLRGINVGGNKRVPMKELCRLALDVGCTRVESYIQSGNLVLLTALEPAALEHALERSIFDHFGFEVEVIARTADEWRRYAVKSPFADAERERPHLLHLGVTKAKPKTGALAVLVPYAKAGERLELRADALWVDFVGGVARSKLSPAVLDRALGSTVTARNFRTVQKLAEMLALLEAASPG